MQGQRERGGHGKRESGKHEQMRKDAEDIDAKFGFERLKEGPPRIGW